MARQRMVTRTIPTTNVTAFCVNKEDHTTFTQTFPLPGVMKDSEQAMKALEKVLKDEPVKAVDVISFEVEEKYYGMLESEFIRLAKVLPKRGEN